ncbi:unnamed protein product [Amoebophrya sp. A120]|nr:unnamed protein product [Amoebophrya sp. A120]|eukprot:GSA120T00015770001.1
MGEDSKMFGYQILFMKEWVADTDEKKMEYRDKMMAWIKECCMEVVYVGPAHAFYETAKKCPPNMFVGKYESLQAAKDAMEKIPDRTEYVKRSMRVIEGPGDLFQKGHAYWIAQIETIHGDGSKWAKYFQAFGEANTSGFNCKYPDGNTKPVQLNLKNVSGSTFYDDSKVGTGNAFIPGTEITDDKGLVIIAEFPDCESGLLIHDAPEYKGSLLASLDMEYTNEEEWEKAEVRILAEVVERDIRIFKYE